MATSEEFKREFKAGNFDRALKLALTEAIELKITTWVMPADADGFDRHEQAKPGDRMYTRINIIDGDIENEIGSRFLNGGPYSELREFHLDQVKQGRNIINRNLQNLQKLFNAFAAVMNGEAASDAANQVEDASFADANHVKRSSGGYGSGMADQNLDLGTATVDPLSINAIGTPPLETAVQPIAETTPQPFSKPPTQFPTEAVAPPSTEISLDDTRPETTIPQSPELGMLDSATIGETLPEPTPDASESEASTNEITFPEIEPYLVEPYLSDTLPPIIPPDAELTNTELPDTELPDNVELAVLPVEELPTGNLDEAGDILFEDMPPILDMPDSEMEPVSLPETAAEEIEPAANPTVAEIESMFSPQTFPAAAMDQPTEQPIESSAPEVLESSLPDSSIEQALEEFLNADVVDVVELPSPDMSTEELIADDSSLEELLSDLADTHTDEAASVVNPEGAALLEDLEAIASQTNSSPSIDSPGEVELELHQLLVESEAAPSAPLDSTEAIELDLDKLLADIDSEPIAPQTLDDLQFITMFPADGEEPADMLEQDDTSSFLEELEETLPADSPADFLETFHHPTPNPVSEEVPSEFSLPDSNSTEFDSIFQDETSDALLDEINPFLDFPLEELKKQDGGK
jgi:hypothetical protein